MTLTADSSVRLRPLAISPRNQDEILVADLERGEYVVLPAVARHVLDALEQESSVAAAGHRARRVTGEEIDVLDFAEALLTLGFIAQIDGATVGADGAHGNWAGGGVLEARLLKLLRPFYSVPAWICYGLLLVVNLLLLATDGRVRPQAGDVFFIANPVVSLGLLVLAGLTIGMGHELAHYFGARREGLPARITVSQRAYLLVLQTDLSAVRMLPRARRFPPLLAGLAYDTVILNLVLIGRACWWTGPGLLARFLAAITVLLVNGLVFQCLVFLRTDLYAVLAIAFDCVDLTRVTRLLLRSRIGRLDEQGRRELAAADPNDLRVARWYQWLFAGGLLVLAANAVVLLGPASWRALRWTGGQLTRQSPVSLGFWETLVLSVLLLFPMVAPWAMMLRDALFAKNRTTSAP
jgi:hypothetical protein